MMPGCRALVDSKSHADTVRQALCAGTVSGIAFTASLVRGLEQITSSTRPVLCIDPPGGVTTGQYVRVVVAYIDARPVRMHERFELLALEAIRDAWPCK
jgi:hypothetical protein